MLGAGRADGDVSVRNASRPVGSHISSRHRLYPDTAVDQSMGEHAPSTLQRDHTVSRRFETLAVREFRQHEPKRAHVREDWAIVDQTKVFGQFCDLAGNHTEESHRKHTVFDQIAALAFQDRNVKHSGCRHVCCNLFVEPVGMDDRGANEDPTFFKPALVGATVVGLEDAFLLSDPRIPRPGAPIRDGVGDLV